MSVFNIISLLGGLALFLFGMSTMSTGLERASGGKLEKTLERFTSNIFKGVLLGTVVTALIQSSSATTVIVVGLVNAGILKLTQAVGIIMGANIGTTVTAQLIRLMGIESDNLFLQIIKPSTLAPIAAVIGILLFMFAKRSVQKNAGLICLGFGILFTGLMSMEEALVPLRDSAAFGAVLDSISAYPIIVLIGAAIFTAIIQSSSASVAILQTLSSTGALSYATCIPAILGQNIGTCITSIISSAGANRNAKRAAIIHLYYNLIGSTIFFVGMLVLQQFNTSFQSFLQTTMDAGNIANFHTMFNVVTTLLLLPFANQLVKLATITLKDKKDEGEAQPDVLDPRLLVSPGLALSQAANTISKMAQYAERNYTSSVEIFNNYDQKKVDRFMEYEDAIDRMEDRLGNYLPQLSDKDISENDSRRVTQYLHLISEFERIGDYSMNIVELAAQMRDKKASFSSVATEELNIAFSAVQEIIGLARQAYETNDLEQTERIEPLEQTIDDIIENLKDKHIERLKNGLCSVYAGVTFLDLMTNVERISDHCSNIGTYIMVYNHTSGDDINRHEYISALHHGGTENYNLLREEYKKKYLEKLNG